MVTKSFTSLRRFSAYALTLLLFCVSFGKGAEAQATAPTVIASYAQTLTPPSKLGAVAQTALDSYGDWLVVDWANGALYEYPANGGPVVTLIAPSGLGSGNNPGIAIDSNNNLYLEGNWDNCLLMLPYDTTTNTWDSLSTITPTNPSSSCVAPTLFAEDGIPAVSPYYFQPWGITATSQNNLIVASQNAGTSTATGEGAGFMFELPVTGAGSTATPGAVNSLILDGISARAISVATDSLGNIYFVEDTTQTGDTAQPGVLMIPAGSTNLSGDVGLARVDPNLPAVTGVTTDAAGNLYISDSTEGVFFVPNPAGAPNPAAAVILTSVPAVGQVSVDSTRDILYIPTTNDGLTKVAFNDAELGSTPAGTPAATSQAVTFSFNASANPASFAIQEAGATTPDFTIATGGTCAAGTYAALSSCTVNVTLSPHVAGSVSAKLVALDASNNVLGSITLHGTGTGSAVEVQPGGESVIGAGLKTPNQVAVDAAGNTYVADSGIPAVEFYPKGYGAAPAATTVGNNPTAPTGVAVDGAGDVFIADSGNAIEVPDGPNGLIAAGQVTLKSGLGTNLNLAADGLGNLYISDPDNHRVVKLGNPNGSFGLLAQTETDLTGFNAPSAVAVDASGDLYVADVPNLIEVTPAGVQSTLLTTLPNTTGIAVDPSGAVYVATTGGTVRIPNESGTLNPGDETPVTGGGGQTNVTSPTSVAIDSAENQYITDATAEDVEFVSASASTNFGTLTSTTGTQSSNYVIVDSGNSALNVGGFNGTPDYSETSTTCVGTAVAVGSTCTATITFNPGPGDQSTLSGEVLIASDAANSPVGVNVTGVGAPLAASTTTVAVTNATVDGAPAVITVTPTAGTGAAPTGQVTLTITGPTLTAPVVVTGTLAPGTATSTVTITPPQLPAGTYTFAVSYQGDRVYGTSTASAQVIVAAGAVTLTQAALVPSLSLYESPAGQWFVLAGGTGAEEPYDGSITQFEYTYPVSVAATDGVALIGQPVYDSTGTIVVGTNYGAITYQGAPYTTNSGCPPVAVASDGSAPLTTDCFTIDTSNETIPDLETTYTITPVYSPAGTGSTDCNPTCVINPNYASATGTPITLTALRNPAVQISSSPSSLTISPGSTATATLTLSSVLGYGIAGAGALLNNYSLPVQLECDGLPAYATCSFSYSPTAQDPLGPDPTDPQSVDVGPPAGTVLSYMNGTAAACAQAAPGAIGGCFGSRQVVMTINTNIPSGVASLHRGQGETAFAAMFGLGLLGFAFGKKKPIRGRVPTLVCLLLCGGIMAGISGCSTTQLGTTSVTPTPAGTYTVTVTATQVGSQVITAQPYTVYGNENQMSLPFTMSVTIQ